MKKFTRILSCGALIAFLTVLIVRSFAAAQSPNAGGGGKVYLPVVLKPAAIPWEKTKWVGIYPQAYLVEKHDSYAVNFFKNFEATSGKKHSVIGWFIDIDDSNINYNLYEQLLTVSTKGYTSFININSVNRTAKAIADGAADTQLANLAKAYKLWLDKAPGQKAYIAPLPEMNYTRDGVPFAKYSGDPDNYKRAFARIQTIFTQQGVARDRVWWVFAPNGWSEPGHEFENYYPGNSAVDVLGFSSYNYGYCSVAYPWQKWESYDTLIAPYITRFTTMAPGKPIVLDQTGTTNQTATGTNNTAKNNWLIANYQYLASQPAVLGIIYYDYDQSAWECNWKVTNSVGSVIFNGYSQAIGTPNFMYLDPIQITQIGY